MHDDTAKAVSMCGHDRHFTGFQSGNYRVAPEWKCAFDGEFKALTSWKVGLGELALVDRVFDNSVVVIVTSLHRRRWRVKAAAPDHDLIRTKLFDSLKLVETCQTAVVSLV